MKAVMLMFDSLNRNMLQPYGCRWTNTPNFQRLALLSVRFQNCYAGSLPCMPARRELQTGRYNFLHRSWGPIEPFDDSMPQILKENGIYSHLVSDHSHYWEDGGATYHQRYSSWENIRGQEGDHWKCLPELMEPYDELELPNKDGLYFHATRVMQRHDAVNRKFETREEDMPLARTVKSGIEFLQVNAGSDGWFLQIECFDPHEPFFVPERYKELYPDNYRGAPTDWPPYHHVTEDRETQAHLRNQYAALLTMCDRYLGKVLDQFDELDLWKDTMLIVNTDHGYLLGEHGWWSKVVMPCYDEIVHTPLFIYDPRFDCAGQVRDEIVQTIDLPATLLEFFDVELPEHMQGRPVRPVIERDLPIRSYALFGIHGSHVGIFDGRFVYMKAPVSENNEPLYEYTVMPTHMRNLFSVGELRKAQAVSGETFAFTKGCPVWKIPKGNGNGKRDFSELLINGKDSEEARYIDNNSLVNAANFGDKMYDMVLDPNQETELNDVKEEVRLANLLQEAMKENDCPLEQFERIGLPGDRDVTETDIRDLHVKRQEQPVILAEYCWSRGAVNAYRALMRFLPESQKDGATRTLEKEIPKRARGNVVLPETVLELIPRVVVSEHVDMIQYFVGLSSRTS